MLQSATIDFINERPLEKSPGEFFSQAPVVSLDSHPLVFLQALEHFFASLLLTRSSAYFSHFREEYLKTLCFFESYPLLSEISYAELLISFCRKNLGLSYFIPDPPMPYSSGVLPLGHGSCWIEGNIPHAAYLFKEGILWALCAQEENSSIHLEAAKKLASWMLDTSDAKGLPYFSLYCPEGSISLLELLTDRYVFLYALEALSPPEENIWAFYTKVQLNALQNLKSSTVGIPAFSLLLAYFFKPLESPIQQSPLSPLYADIHCALVNARSESYSMAVTLLGKNTGLGCLKWGDLSLVNFGPQEFPLGDCTRFGLDRTFFANQYSPATIHTSTDGQSFALKGKSRLLSDEDDLPFGKFACKVPKAWIEYDIQFANPELKVQAQLLSFSLRGSDLKCAFTFYFKTRSCQLETGEILEPLSLNQYQGHSQKVTFFDRSHRIEITCNPDFPEMIIIPLGGGDNFWGADFLLAYPFTTVLNATWTIHLKSLEFNNLLA